MKFNNIIFCIMLVAGRKMTDVEARRSYRSMSVPMLPDVQKMKEFQTKIEQVKIKKVQQMEGTVLPPTRQKEPEKKTRRGPKLDGLYPIYKI